MGVWDAYQLGVWEREDDGQWLDLRASGEGEEEEWFAVCGLYFKEWEEEKNDIISYPNKLLYSSSIT